MSKSDLKKVYSYYIQSRECVITTNEGIVIIDNGEQGVLIGFAFT